MKPTTLGFSLTITAGPSVQLSPESWGENRRHVVAYRYTLMRHGRTIYSGPYYQGTGHIERQSILYALRQCRRETADKFAQVVLTHGADASWIEPEKSTPVAVAILQCAAMHQKLTATLDDVFYCLMMDSAAYMDGHTFATWCNEFGHSTDSIRARSTFDACDEIGRALSQCMTPDERDAMREWASNQ